MEARAGSNCRGGVGKVSKIHLISAEAEGWLGSELGNFENIISLELIFQYQCYYYNGFML